MAETKNLKFTVDVATLSDETRDTIAALAAGMMTPPRYDLPPGVIAGSDGKFYAPGDVVRTLPDDMWTAYFADGHKRTYRNDEAVKTPYWYEVRPTAANPIPTLPPFTFRLPDGELACYRRDAAKLREAGARVLHTDDGAESNPTHDHIWPDQVMRVEFPAQPKTDVIDTRLAKGRTLPDGRQVLCTGDSGDEGPWYRCYGESEATYAATVEVLATDGEA